MNFLHISLDNFDKVLFSIGNFDIDASLFLFIVVGFLAQAIDGCLGMAYGVSSNSFLLSLGVPVPVASASVHLAEVFTTAVSGLSHHKLGNVDKSLLKKLVIPGILGSIVGAYGLTTLWQNFNASQKNIIKIVIAIYLLAMGIRILIKAFNKAEHKERNFSNLALGILAGVGGFSDAIGGGGWGPIVTTTLVSNGHNPRKTIGTVNATEFFVTIAQVIVFLLAIELMNWQVIIGLIIGGSIAAPLAAKICKYVPAKKMMAIVGIVIIALQLRTLVMNLPSLFH